MMFLARSIPVLLLASCVSPAHGEDLAAGWTICMRDLTLVETIVERADETGLVTVNEFGIRGLVALSDIYFALPTHPPAAPDASEAPGVPREQRSPVRMISLTDGQVIRGSITDSPSPDTLALSVVAGTSMHGDARISLERVLSVGDEPYTGLMRGRDGADEDTITTRNGDELSGFIESIGTTTIITSAGVRIPIETARIGHMLIANPPERVPGVYVRTTDGLVVRTESFDFDFQQPIMVTVGAESLGMGDDARTTWIFDPGAARGIEVVDPGSRVAALCEIAPESIEPMGERDWTPAPSVMLGADQHAVLGSIDLHAPLRAVYPVPEHASRFACELVAPINTWTDCVARVTAVGYDGTRTELLAQRLSAEQDRASVNTVLGEGTARIEFEIDPGAYGPIQDRVIVRRPRVVVRD